MLFNNTRGRGKLCMANIPLTFERVHSKNNERNKISGDILLVSSFFVCQSVRAIAWYKIASHPSHHSESYMMSASHSEPAHIDIRPLLTGSSSSEDLEGQEIQANHSLLAAGHQLYQGPFARY